MQYRSLGRTGVPVSELCLGCMNFGGRTDRETSLTIINRAIEAGINFIDTANMYQSGASEESLGVALKGKWDKVVLATKGFWQVGDGPNDRGASRYHLMNAVEDSLRRLQTDHIDLYQMHRWDDETPLEETLRTLDDLVRAGKIRYIGASNYMSWQLARANLLSEINHWAPMVSVQNHYHMFERQAEDEMLPYCEAHGAGFIPFFPLAGGFLTGKYKRGEAAPAGSRGESSPYVQKYMTDENYDKVEALTTWANERDRSMAELAQAWLMAQPGVCSVISGVTRLDQLQNNAKAADWALTAEEVEEVNGVLAG